jgi:hypothetical protein
MNSRVPSFLLRAIFIMCILLALQGLLLATVLHTQTVAQRAPSMIKKTTSGGSLDISLQPSTQPVHTKAQTQFKVTFLQKGTSKVQPHIDYDFIIMNGSGKAIFQASNETGQAGLPIHTAEGVINIPYKFQNSGNYSIKIPVYGILFNPIRPENTEFMVGVT